MLNVGVQGRPSWDPTVVMAAIRGAEATGCVHAGQGGHVMIDSEGLSTWVPGNDTQSTHTYMKATGAAYSWPSSEDMGIVTESDFLSARAIDVLLCKAPKFGPTNAAKSNIHVKVPAGLARFEDPVPKTACSTQLAQDTKFKAPGEVKKHRYYSNCPSMAT